MTEEVQVENLDTTLQVPQSQVEQQPPVNPAAPKPGVEENVTADTGAVNEEQPEAPVKEVEDTDVIFVPFEDFSGRINQEDFNFRADIPTKVPKAQANVWLEGKRGYIK